MGNGTSIGRVRGLGSAHSGAHHWIVERVSGFASLALSLYLVFAILTLPDLGYASVREWIVQPIPALAIALLVVTLFWHSQLGLRVLIEDYVHEHANRFALLVLNSLLAWGGAAFGLFCLVRLVLGAK